MDVFPEGGGIAVIEQIEALDDVVVLPDGALGLVPAGVGAELADDDALGRRLQGKRDKDAQAIVPFLLDQFLVDFPDWL